MLIFFAVLLVWPSVAFGVCGGASPNLTAASPNRADIADCHTDAVDGDTISVPSGTGTGWTSTLTITKAITLQGAGEGVTIFQDDQSSGTYLIDVTPVAAKATRLTAFSITKGTITTGTDVIRLNGLNTNGGTVRVDHVTFGAVGAELNYRALIQIDGAIGVADNNTMYQTPNHFSFYIQHSTWNGSSYGDGAWNEGSQFGTDRFFFIESNTITNTGAVYEYIDGACGGRGVIRYNTVTNSRTVFHGTESTSRCRGTRAIELYGNTFTGPGSSTELMEIRSGSFLVYGNTFSSYGAGALPVGTAKAFRLTDTFATWGGADGTNTADKNLAGGPFDSGTATSGGSLTMTDTAKSWTTDQWVGYTLRNTTTGKFSFVTSNTSNTITFYSSLFGNMSFSASDVYDLYKVTAAIDQPGLGSGGLVSSATPVYPGGWNDQVVDAMYEWGNTTNGVSSSGFSTVYPSVVQNTHYFNATAAPGYTAYPFPHLLRTEFYTGKRLPPGLLRKSEGPMPFGRFVSYP